MNKSYPLVSVLMSVYNGEDYLREAINSILHQTFADFEFLIIDDGSTDNTRSIIKSFTDERIRLFTNSKNIGLSLSLNKGINISRGIFIARMDADDKSKSNRLATQVSYLNANKTIDVCGSWLETIGKKKELWRFPSTSENIKISLLFTNVIAHPSVMLRKDSLLKNKLLYNTEYKKMQDYELWSRAVPYLNFANITEPLLEYRTSEKHYDGDLINKSNDIWGKIVTYQLERLGFDSDQIKLNIHWNVALETINEFSQLSDMYLWFMEIYGKNNKINIYKKCDLLKYLSKKMFYSLTKIIF